MPDSLEELDSLLVMVARSRRVQRDGIRFEGLRFTSPTLAAYVGEPVTIRYDPRDVSEIRVFHRNDFLCRAISPEHVGETVTLKEIQIARAAYRRQLRKELKDKRGRVSDFLPDSLHSANPPVTDEKSMAQKSTWKKSGIRVYEEED